LFWEVKGLGVKPEVFYLPFNRAMWVAMEELADELQEMSQITLAERMRRNGEVEQMLVSRISDMLVGMVHVRSLEKYVKIIMGKANVRNLVKMCNYISSYALDEEDEPDETLIKAESEMLEFVSNALRTNTKRRNTDFVHVADDKAKFLETLQKLHRGESDALPTGIRPLDQKLEGGGVNPQGFYLVAAEPKAGKTSLCLGIGGRIARQFAEEFKKTERQRSVGILSMEMRREALEMRLFSGHTEIPFEKLSRPGFRGSDYDVALRSIDTFFDFPLYINDAVYSMPELCRAAERLVYGPAQAGLLIIDYLQLLSLRKVMMRSSDPMNRVQEVTAISREIKHLAQELNVPILGISSLSRLGELRESGQLDYDCEALLMLENPAWTAIAKYMRDPKYDPMKALAMRHELDSQTIWDINVRLKYQRNGPTGDIPLKFLRRFMKFVDLDEFEQMMGKGRASDHDTLWSLS
jgi:replicative DNA helicase